MATNDIDFRSDNPFGDEMLDLLDSIEQGTSEVFGQQYRTIQWVNGDPGKKKYADMGGQGGFFFPEKIAFDEEVLLAHGWKKEMLVHSSTAETPGYWKRELTIVPITTREAWIVKQEGGGETLGLVGFDNSARYTDFNAFRKAKWDGFEKAKHYGIPTNRLQILCLVEGLEEQGPVALTLGGSVARAFYDERGADTVLGDLHKSVIVVANAKSDEAVRAAAAKASNDAEKAQILKRLGRKWPMRAFRITVGANRDDKGAPVYTTVGKGNATSDVTLPIALGLPAKGEPVDLNKWRISAGLLATVNEIFAEVRTTWAVEWDALLPAGEAAAAPVEDKPAVVNHSAAQKVGL